MVRVFICLLSGLFCCLGFSVVAFVFFCLGGGAGPAQTAKKKTSPPKQQKKKKKHAPHLPSVLLFLLFGRVGVPWFLLSGRGTCFLLFFLFGCVVFGCLGGGRVLFFAVWAGGVLFFLLFGRGTGVHSLTGLPGLSSSDPTTKKTKQQTQKKHGFQLYIQQHSSGTLCTITRNHNKQKPYFTYKRQHASAYMAYMPLCNSKYSPLYDPNHPTVHKTSARNPKHGHKCYILLGLKLYKPLNLKPLTLNP